MENESYSLTCATSLAVPGGFILSQFYEEAQDGLDFLEFVIDLVENGTLGVDDFLIRPIVSGRGFLCPF